MTSTPRETLGVTASLPGDRTAASLPGDRTTASLPGDRTTASLPGDRTTASLPGDRTQRHASDKTSATCTVPRLEDGSGHLQVYVCAYRFQRRLQRRGFVDHRGCRFFSLFISSPYLERRNHVLCVCHTYAERVGASFK